MLSNKNLREICVLEGFPLGCGSINEIKHRKIEHSKFLCMISTQSSKLGTEWKVSNQRTQYFCFQCQQLRMGFYFFIQSFTECLA